MAWLSDWAHRIEISIDYTNDIGASVTGFPVTIHLKAANGDTEYDQFAKNSRNQS